MDRCRSLLGTNNNSLRIDPSGFSTKAGKRGYVEVDHPDFGKDLMARYNPETDTLVILCRSGNRSCAGCNEAIKAGWPEDKVFNMMGGAKAARTRPVAYTASAGTAAGNWKACPGPTAWITALCTSRTWTGWRPTPMKAVSRWPYTR